jgi:hypothetical protein
MLPDFNEDNWTSSNRSRAGFASRGEDRADFFYYDRHGLLAGVLGLDAINCPKGFLIEVKSSPGPDDQTFHWSIRQLAVVTKFGFCF